VVVNDLTVSKQGGNPRDAELTLSVPY
jgi:hypothetical protein